MGIGRGASTVVSQWRRGWLLSLKIFSQYNQVISQICSSLVSSAGRTEPAEELAVSKLAAAIRLGA